ncbi:acylamino-acid-releasing enzyme-like [Polyodon spathula]|nr:acylamino-acid-releasing enzyme-like [Polyodon spathula]
MPGMLRVSDMESKILTAPQAISAVYREYSQFPSPLRASIEPGVPSVQGGRYININTEWSQGVVERGELVRFCRRHTLLCEEKSVLHSVSPGHCTETKRELLSSQSPSGTLKAVVREIGHQGEEKQFLEIWSRNGLKRSTDLTHLKIHGKVYEEGQFGVLAWSHSKCSLLYVAERQQKTTESFFRACGTINENEGAWPEGNKEKKAGADEEMQKGDKPEYSEDWGEGLSSKRVPVLCVADTEKSSISVLQGVPGHVSPGQPFWAPGDSGVGFVGWWHEPFRLGLKFCYNRRSALFYVDLQKSKCELLSSDACSVSSPRLSPDQRYIVYLEQDVFGPHSQCQRLLLYDWQSKETSMLVDIVKRPKADEFAGLYGFALPKRCWSEDSQRVLFTAPRRSRKEIFAVDINTRSVTPLTTNSDFESWTLLTVEQDLMVVSCSSLNCPPCLKVGFLPSAGSESGVSWVALDEAQPIPDLEWKVLDITPPPEEENRDYPGLDFDALLLKPRKVKPGEQVPLIVQAHGGPHSVFVAEWQMLSAVFVRTGFAVLLVNYRGSTGFGQDSIMSLIGNVGSQDVKDMQRAVLTLLQSDATLDPERVSVLGGSHGGFLACHLIGQHPDFYRACAMRNPVINYATLLGTSDIPDWRYTAVGLDYSFGRLPTAEALATMLNCSPIIHAEQIKTPVLLMLGGKDKRVSPHQGIELYRALKSRSAPIRLLWYPGDGHSLSKVDTVSDCFMNTVLWFLQHLKH